MKQFTFDDILIMPQYSNIKSRKDIDLTTSAFGTKFSLPVIVSPMDTVVNYEIAFEVMSAGGLAVLHRFCAAEDQVKLFKRLSGENFPMPAVAVGVNDQDRIKALMKVGAQIFFVDIANGHSENCLCAKKLIDKCGKDAYVVTGSVVGRKATSWAIKNSFSASRVGIGNGALCTTRVKTGVGMLQGSAIMESVAARDGGNFQHLIIADGGIDTPGNICKALMLGADFAMIGSWFGKTDEAPGRKHKDGTKELRGMASKSVNDDCFGGLTEWKTAEGVSKFVHTIGSVKDVLRDIEGGLRSCLSYVGKNQLSSLKYHGNEYYRFVEHSAIKENGSRI